MTRLTRRSSYLFIAAFAVFALVACRSQQTDQTAISAATSAPEAQPTVAPTVPPTPMPTATIAPRPTVAQPTGPTPVPTVAFTDPVATEYDLGETVVIQEAHDEGSRFREMPVRLNGVMAVPKGAGPFPVVVIIHGNHPGCPMVANSEADKWPCTPEEEQPNYRGFGYLVEALANRGFVAVSINANAQYTLGFGEPNDVERIGQLVDLHIAALRSASAGESDPFPINLKGKVDASRIAFAGHSQGGEFANRYIRKAALNTANAAGVKQYGPVRGLLQIAPAVVYGDSPGSTVPLATILPACDADVKDLKGQYYYEAQRANPDRYHWATSVYLLRANHNGFNSILEPDLLGESENRVDCNVLLTPESQQEFLAQYAADFFTVMFDTSPDVLLANRRLGLDAETRSPTSLYGFAAAVSALPGKGDERRLMTPATAEELTVDLLGGEVESPGVTTLFCPEGYYTPSTDPNSGPCRRVTVNLPGYPAALLLNWQRLGAELKAALPEGKGDVTGYDAVTLRVAVDPLSVFNAPDSPQSFSLRLTDARGRSVTVVVPPDQPALAFPAGVRYQETTFNLQAYTGHVHMSTVRVPLAEFDDIDLSRIAEVAVVFDQIKSGSLFVGDLGFSATPRFNGSYSTLLLNRDGSQNAVKGIGRINFRSNCTATFIRTSDDAAAPAYAITNGHCAQDWLANDVFIDQPAESGSMIFNYFVDTQDAQIVVPLKALAYSTMKGRDVAIVELDATVGSLVEQGIEPFAIAAAAPEDLSALVVYGAPQSGLASEVAFMRRQDCAGGERANALEFVWHFDDLYRVDCQDIFGGSSGSPVFAGLNDEVFALINTTTIGALTPCYLGGPCEVQPGGTTRMYHDTSYATPVDGVGACFGADGRFDISLDGCPLDAGRQLLVEGTPPLLTQTAESWNATLVGDLPYYRFKTGLVGEIDCRAEDGYGYVLSLAKNPIIDVPIANREGSHQLCILAGESETIDETWQSLSFPTVVRVQIDRTPPIVEPELGVTDIGDALLFEPIFAVAELSDYELKFGPTGETDCADPEGYMRYRRIPMSIEKSEGPATVCVIGYDTAGNKGAPKAYLLNQTP